MRTEKIIENKTLRKLIFDSFKYLLTVYDEKQVLGEYYIKESIHNGEKYEGLVMPAFFGNENMIALLKNEQNIADLTSASTQRFFVENFTILKNKFSYFTTQWSSESNRKLNLVQFNKYLDKITNSTFEIIKENTIYFLVKKVHSISTLHLPNNTIYFGSPGTGKSHKVNEILEPLNKQFYERITFHPDYDNASFIGGYKPVSDENGGIKYRFVPQVFTNIYVRAWEDLENAYFLAIEEINRGNCAEIFGEIFQLLDRNSRYTVSPSNELKNYLVEQLGETHEGIKDGLRLPVNLSLLATMNTSDQSLFPMDSAFKRRWDWEYMPICYKEFDEEEQPNNSFNFLVKIDKNSSFRWIDFIKAVNDRIRMNENLGMDKCIGNYFIKPKNQEISLKEFVNKAIFYLWNDVFKDEDENNSIFAKGDFYEDFFPIQSRGIELVTKLVESLSIDIITFEDIE